MKQIPKWKKDLAMYATYSRIFFGPIIIGVLYLDWPGASVLAAVLFMIASLTDWLDGYWARRYQSESAMGQFMDPIADKILVLAALIMLLDMGRVDPVMVVLLISRDIFIGGIRSVAAANSVIISAKPFGKWKTAIQMVCIPCLLIKQDLWGLPVGLIGYYGMWASVLLSLLSGAQYTLGYYKGRN